MYEHIAVPVDLAHADKLEKALKVTGDLAKLYSSKVFLLAVSTSAANEVSHDPEEFKSRLDAFAEMKKQEFGVEFVGVVVPCTDPAADMDHVLNHWLHDNPIDLIVMASHVPSFKDHFFHPHGSYLTSHTDKSIMLVR